MIDYGYWFYEELKDKIGKGNPPLVLTTPSRDAFSVTASSNKLELLRQSPVCVQCHRRGVIWILQSHKGERPHLNLYAVSKNTFTLMTQDHIIPKCRGGRNCLSNLQVMCEHCNRRKGSKCPNMIASEQRSGMFTNESMRIGLSTLTV